MFLEYNFFMVDGGALHSLLVLDGKLAPSCYSTVGVHRIALHQEAFLPVYLPLRKYNARQYHWNAMAQQHTA